MSAEHRTAALERLEREHRRRDLAGGRIGNRRRSLVPARAAAHRGSRARALRRCRQGRTDRGDRAPPAPGSRARAGARASAACSRAWRTPCPAGWPSAPRAPCPACGPRCARRSRARRRGRCRGSPRRRRRYSATAARSDQSGIERENSRSIVAASWSGRSLVDPARSDGPRSGEGERRERVRVVERGDLGDHPADADARQVRRPVVEFAGERRGVGGEIAQRVRRSLGIDGGRRRRSRAGRSARRGARRARAPRRARRARRAWSCRPRAERAAPPRRRSARPRA